VDVLLAEICGCVETSEDGEDLPRPEASVCDCFDEIGRRLAEARDEGYGNDGRRHMSYSRDATARDLKALGDRLPLRGEWLRSHRPR
jgi:hypothetical protein